MSEPRIRSVTRADLAHGVCGVPRGTTAPRLGHETPALAGLGEWGRHPHRIRGLSRPSRSCSTSSTDILPLDAVSRMANGYYVLWSRDPHIGRGRVRLEPVAILRRYSSPVVQAASFRSWRHTTSPGALSACSPARVPCTRSTPPCANGACAGRRELAVDADLRDQPNGPVLRRQRHERHALHIPAGDDHPIFHALDSQTAACDRSSTRDRALGLAYLNRYEALGAAGMAAVVVLGVSYWRRPGYRALAHPGCVLGHHDPPRCRFSRPSWRGP